MPIFENFHIATRTNNSHRFKRLNYYSFGMAQPQRSFEAVDTGCQITTTTETIYPVNDNFSTCDGSWTAISSADVICFNSQLQILNTSSSSKNIGAKKTFTGGTGTHTVSFRLDNNICMQYVVWPPSATPKPITVYIRDAANNVVASHSYTSTGGNTTYSFTYTPSIAGTHSIEFYMPNATALCYFVLNDVKISYDSTHTDTICNDFQAGYRFGYNTQLKDDEIYGKKNAYTAQFWEYDPRVVKRWNTDPKPDDAISPYAIERDNPILYNDPDGDFVPQLVGALVGAGVEIGTQMLSNKIEGKNLNKIDWTAVGIAAAEGGLTAGASVGRRLAIKAGATLLKNTVDYVKDNGFDGPEDIHNIVKNSVIDGAVDALTGGTVKAVVGKVGKNVLSKVAEKAIISNKEATKVVKTITNSSYKTAKETATKIGLREGTKEAANAIRGIPQTLGEVGSKAASNKVVTAVKDNTNIK